MQISDLEVTIDIVNLNLDISKVSYLPICLGSIERGINSVELLHSTNTRSYSSSNNTMLVAETIGSLYDYLESISTLFGVVETIVSKKISEVIENNIEYCIESNIESSSSSNEYYLDVLQSLINSDMCDSLELKADWSVLKCGFIKAETIFSRVKILLDTVIRDWFICEIDKVLTHSSDPGRLQSSISYLLDSVKHIDSMNMLVSSIDRLYRSLDSSSFSLDSIISTLELLVNKNYYFFISDSLSILNSEIPYNDKFKYYINNFRKYKM